MIGDKDTSWGASCEFVNGSAGDFNTTCAPRGDIVNVTFRDSFFNHTSTAIIMKSMPVFEGSIRNVTYENLQLHNVRTGVCINTAAQECFNRGGDTEEDPWAAHARRKTIAAASSSAGVGAVGVGVMNVDAIVVRNISGDHVGLAGYLNCPQNLKWVGPQGNCTALTLEDIQFPGAKAWECQGSVFGNSDNHCNPPTCHLNATQQNK
jgi:hypothetical protein